MTLKVNDKLKIGELGDFVVLDVDDETKIALLISERIVGNYPYCNIRGKIPLYPNSLLQKHLLEHELPYIQECLEQAGKYRLCEYNIEVLKANNEIDFYTTKISVPSMRLYKQHKEQMQKIFEQTIVTWLSDYVPGTGSVHVYNARFSNQFDCLEGISARSCVGTHVIIMLQPK